MLCKRPKKCWTPKDCSIVFSGSTRPTTLLTCTPAQRRIWLLSSAAVLWLANLMILLGHPACTKITEWSQPPRIQIWKQPTGKTTSLGESCFRKPLSAPWTRGMVTLISLLKLDRILPLKDLLWRQSEKSLAPTFLTLVS